MSDGDLVIDPKTSALVLIDLEKRILNFPAAPNSRSTSLLLDALGRQG